jgi:hypothetical protein
MSDTKTVPADTKKTDKDIGAALLVPWNGVIGALSNSCEDKNMMISKYVHRQHFPSQYFKVCSLRHLHASMYLPFACMIDHDMLFILWYV